MLAKAGEATALARDRQGEVLITKGDIAAIALGRLPECGVGEIIIDQQFFDTLLLTFDHDRQRGRSAGDKSWCGCCWKPVDCWRWDDGFSNRGSGWQRFRCP